LDVADFLIKNGAILELGASTPLMEAAQEGHIDLVRYLLECGADVHAQTTSADTALTYACENGHTDVSDLLLQFGANLVSKFSYYTNYYNNTFFIIRNMNLKVVVHP